MRRKAVWIFVLLAVLLAISAGVAFGANVTTPAQATQMPQEELGTFGGNSTMELAPAWDYHTGNCHHDEGVSEAAY
ncbi:MAG TPA: hypothetical protein VFD70_18890 [Anaerolineae bacterium]|nr:hypothetical protein [Anaerolineae bacterium]